MATLYVGKPDRFVGRDHVGQAAAAIMALFCAYADSEPLPETLESEITHPFETAAAAPDEGLLLAITSDDPAIDETEDSFIGYLVDEVFYPAPPQVAEDEPQAETEDSEYSAPFTDPPAAPEAPVTGFWTDEHQPEPEPGYEMRLSMATEPEAEPQDSILSFTPTPDEDPPHVQLESSAALLYAPSEEFPVQFVTVDDEHQQPETEDSFTTVPTTAEPQPDLTFISGWQDDYTVAPEPSTDEQDHYFTGPTDEGAQPDLTVVAGWQDDDDDAVEQSQLESSATVLYAEPPEFPAQSITADDEYQAPETDESVTWIPTTDAPPPDLTFVPGWQDDYLFEIERLAADEVADLTDHFVSTPTEDPPVVPELTGGEWIIRARRRRGR